MVYEHSKMLFLDCLVSVFPFCLSFYQPCKKNADISTHILLHVTGVHIIELNGNPVQIEPLSHHACPIILLLYMYKALNGAAPSYISDSINYNTSGHQDRFVNTV